MIYRVIVYLRRKDFGNFTSKILCGVDLEIIFEINFIAFLLFYDKSKAEYIIQLMYDLTQYVVEYLNLPKTALCM